MIHNPDPDLDSRSKCIKLIYYRYEGEWVEGAKQGKGQYLYASGDVFEGNYENNNRHGPGLLKKADGEIREENWKEDKLTSYNTIKEKDAK